MTDPDAPPADVIPLLTEVVDVYDELVELANKHLQRPVSTKINTWKDGTFRIRVFHQRRPNAVRRCTTIAPRRTFSTALRGMTN